MLSRILLIISESINILSADTLEIYDFVADIFMPIRGESPLIGEAHIWVPKDYISYQAQTVLSLILS